MAGSDSVSITHNKRMISNKDDLVRDDAHPTHFPSVFIHCVNPSDNKYNKSNHLKKKNSHS